MNELYTQVAEDFPYRDGRIYLNSAGAGLAWAGQGRAAAQHYAEIARLGAGAQPLWQERAEIVRDRFSQMVGVPVRQVCFFRNTTDVINLVANSVEWQPGDEVIVAGDDFPSVRLPWQKAALAGGRVVEVEVRAESERTQQLLDAITPQTRVLALSHVNAATGTRADLKRLGRACQDAGALLVVDGIEALGAVPVDLSSVDVYASAVFKWLLSGFGTSIGVFSDRAHELLTPAYRGYRNPPPSDSFEYADPNYPGLYVLDETLRYLEALGWERIYEAVESLTGQLFDGLERAGIEATTPRQASAGIVAFQVPGIEAGAFVDGLGSAGIDVVARSGNVRVSPHFYNSEAHIAEFLRAARELLTAGARH